MPLRADYRQLVVASMVLTLLWAGIFWPTLQNMESVWRGSDTYMHCYVIPFIAVWLLYDRKAHIQAQAQPHVSLLPVLAAFALIWLAGYAADINTLTHFSTVICLQLLLLGLVGKQLGKQVAFPLAYLIFMVPFGDALNLPLQELTATASVTMLHWAGVPVLREGLYLTTPVGQFEVAEACSGLRFLIASIAIGTLFSYLTFQHWWKHLLFVTGIIAASIVGNFFRAFFLIWIGEKSQMQYGFGADHFVYGWLVFGLVMFAAFWLGGRFADREPETVATTAPDTSSRQLLHKPFWLATLAILAVVLLLREQIQLTIAPAQPAQLKTPATFVAVENSVWRPGFKDGLDRVLAKASDGRELLWARYGHKQQQGELIAWQNNLYHRKSWTLLAAKDLQLHGQDFALLSLRGEQGQSLTVLYQFRIGEQVAIEPLQVKLYQTLALLKGEQSLSEVRALALPQPARELSTTELAAAAELLSGLTP